MPTSTMFPGNLFELKLDDLEFYRFANMDGDVAAIGWVAHHQYARSIPPSLGIGRLRARIGDVQIGEGGVFDEVFKETRFNGWCVGEIHILDRKIQPNGRRDNFELNHHTYNLLAQIGPKAIELSHRCRDSSVSRNVILTAENFLRDVEALTAADAPPLDAGTVSKMRSSLERILSRIKSIEGEDQRSDFENRLLAAKVVLQNVTPVGSAVVDVAETTALIRKLITNRDQGSRLIKALQLISG